MIEAVVAYDRFPDFRKNHQGCSEDGPRHVRFSYQAPGVIGDVEIVLSTTNRV